MGVNGTCHPVIQSNTDIILEKIVTKKKTMTEKLKILFTFALFVDTCICNLVIKRIKKYLLNRWK